ncbi:HDIG domain-containing protein [Modicisalibacter ilicicola DSM 19980]|uniref:HDIG domain-containing protein n=1 Tax=Modicisalibacter ilicicola DSM 19980 TaxID=1121942 RepID=A0A1M5A0E7_9GAMM|nr:HD-GYP domain-containing protein [Halomonas ilicicola]SHF23745.1 HDIG domain-containing protein [Halomonas ilicicola DSM 19980]
MQQLGEHDTTPEQLIRVPVTCLQAGMFVAALDRPWIETPFLLEGLLLRESRDIHRLQRHCRHVYVDAERSETGVQATLRGLQTLKGPSSPRRPFPARRPYPIQRPVEQEFVYARHDFNNAKEMVHRLLRDKHDWHRDIPKVKQTVSRFAGSILANPSALGWLTRLKHKSEYTAEHCLNVGILAMTLGRHLGQDRNRIEELGLAGMLHDLGKMKLDQAILAKPGKLTHEEFAHVKTHTLEGYAMLENEEGLPTVVREACRDHHERLDGSGYPHGKRAGDIGETARIIAIVDTYDAISSRRVYEEARPTPEALRILYQARGTLYDDELVIRFIECIGVYPPGSIVELNNGMVGVVLSVEPDKRLKPRLLLMLDERKALMPKTVIDLADASVSSDRQMHVRKVLPPGAFGIHLEGLMEHLIP